MPALHFVVGGQIAVLLPQERDSESTTDFITTFISSLGIRETSSLPSQTAQGLPACRSSIGPLRKA